MTVVLSGCTAGEGDPTVLPPASSASFSAPAAPSPPPEAAAETAAGASAFARYYLGLISQAFATANPEVLRAVTAPGCEGCERLIASVEDLRMQERKRVGGEYLVREAAAPPVVNGDVVVDISYERAAGGVVDASGSVITSSPPVPLTNAQVRLLRRGGGWVVQGYRVVEV